jgi:phosphatidate cytidylyltransferase
MLKTRLITSLLLVTALVASLVYLPPIYWYMMMLSIVSIGAWEWAGMAHFKKPSKFIYASLILIPGLLIVFYKPQILPTLIFWGVLVATIFWLVIAPVILITKMQIKNRMIFSIIGFAVILPFGLSMIALKEINPLLLLLFMVAVWIADSAAFFAGKRFGKHKLAPMISPGKTWEGVIGAWVAVSIYGVLLCYLTKQNYWFILVLWGVTVLSIMGDLLESLFKRQAGVKDSGVLLPGHGGVLDRIDGLTSSMPLVTFLITLPVYYNLYLYIKAVVFHA